MQRLLFACCTNDMQKLALQYDQTLFAAYTEQANSILMTFREMCQV